MKFEDRIFRNFKRRAKEAFKYHKCEHLIPKTDHDQEYEKILGCDRFTYVKYLKSKFNNGMSQFNYGIEGWHIDHIFPLARANPNNLIFWLHYLNTQPLWKKQNQDKCDLIFDLNEVRLIEKSICESKNIDYIDTIDPIKVLKYSRPYLRELKIKGQISDNEISKIKESHRNSLKLKNKSDKLKKREELKKPEETSEEKRQKRIAVYKQKEIKEQNKEKINTNELKFNELKFNELKLMYDELNKKYLILQKENEQLKNKLHKPKECYLTLPKIENTNLEDIKMFEELFKQ